MNLYSNIGNFSSAFNGWRAEPKESFRASDWQPIPPPAIPQPSGYIPSSQYREHLWTILPTKIILIQK